MGEVIEREERESLLWFNKKASLTSLLQTIKKPEEVGQQRVGMKEGTNCSVAYSRLWKRNN